MRTHFVPLACAVFLALTATPLLAAEGDEVPLRDWTPPRWEGNPKKKVQRAEKKSAPAAEPAPSETDPPVRSTMSRMLETLSPNEPDQADVSFSYYYLAGTNFHPRNTATGMAYTGTGCAYTIGGTDRILVAPLILPDGAELKYLRIFYVDTDATYNVKGYITKYATGSSTNDITSVASTGSSGYGTALGPEMGHDDPPPTTPHEYIDNFGYAYTLILWPDVSSSTAQVCGLRVAYYAPTPSVYTFYPITPCRVADTRGNGFGGQYGPPILGANAARSFDIEGQCGVPASAVAVSFNFTATQTQGPGDIRTYPKAGSVPLVSTLNYVAGDTIANATIVPLGGSPKGIAVFPDVSGTHLVIDINGYFAP